MSKQDVELEARPAEQGEFEPPGSFVEQANVSDPSIHDEFADNWPACWDNAAALLDWSTKYEQVLNDSNPLFYEWFTGGELNVSENCLDCHLDERGDEEMRDEILAGVEDDIGPIARPEETVEEIQRQTGENRLEMSTSKPRPLRNDAPQRWPTARTNTATTRTP